jgi:acetyl esterase/lipase
MPQKFFQILTTLTVLALSTVAQTTIALYSDSIPNSISGPNEEYSKGEDLQIFNVTRPTLSAYIPSKHQNPTAAVIICPGGGYGSLYIDREGHDAAKFFVQRGVAAFVLKYRLPSNKTMHERSIGPLQDAQQAIKIVRQNALQYNVDPNKVGIMGFSAGGHLAASAGILHAKQTISNKERISLRPDYMILVYPVITMDTVLGHKGSTFNLLGNQPSAEQIRNFSLHLHVDEKTSPAYITVAADDEMLSSTMLACTAFKEKSVSFESHIYSTGGHGYLKYPAFQDWMRLIVDWMKVNKWIDR